MSPTKFINYAKKLAVYKNNSANYNFFENRYGFYFRSLDSFYKINLYQ